MSLADAAVVGDEEDVGVFVEAFRLEEIHHPPDLLVAFLNGLDVFGRHPFVGMAHVIGMHVVEEDELGLVAVFLDETHGPVAELGVFGIARGEGVVEDLGVVGPDQGLPVPVKGRPDPGDLILQDLENGGEIPFGILLYGAEFVFVNLPAVVRHSMHLGPGSAEVARVVGERDGGHHVAGAVRGGSLSDQGIDVGRTGLGQGIHADAVKRHDQDPFGPEALLGLEGLGGNRHGIQHRSTQRRSGSQGGLEEVSS